VKSRSRAGVRGGIREGEGLQGRAREGRVNYSKGSRRRGHSLYD